MRKRPRPSCVRRVDFRRLLTQAQQRAHCPKPRSRMRGRGALRIQSPLEDLHLGAHLCGGLITQLPVFFERTIENALQLRRQSWDSAACGGTGCRFEDALEDDRRSVSVEGLLAGGHLVEATHQAKTGRCGRRAPRLAPARATYRRWCPGRCLDWSGRERFRCRRP